MREASRAEGSRESGKEPPSQDQGMPSAQWKSIIVQSDADSYREVYFLDGSGVWNQSTSKSQVLTIGDKQVLETIDASSFDADDCLGDGRWVLEASGPWLIDFSAVQSEVLKHVPADGELAGEFACGAIAMQELEARMLIQKRCESCGKVHDFLGTETVRFLLDGHRAVPVSSRLTPWRD